MDTRPQYRVRYERHDKPGEIKTALWITYHPEQAAKRFEAVRNRKTTKHVMLEARTVTDWVIDQEHWDIRTMRNGSRVSEESEHDAGQGVTTGDAS